MDEQAHDKHIIKSNKVIDSYATKEQGSQNREASGISNYIGNNTLKTNNSFPSTYDDTTIVPIPLIEIQDKREEISLQELVKPRVQICCRTYSKLTMARTSSKIRFILLPLLCVVSSKT